MTKKEIERRITEHAKAIKELIKQKENAKDELELRIIQNLFGNGH